MAKETSTKPTDEIIVISPEQKAEHERREKEAAKRNKKLTNPNDSAKPAENPITEPASVADSAGPATEKTADKKKKR